MKNQSRCRLSQQALRFVAVCVAGMLLTINVSQRALAEHRPNILFVLIDDMGWPDLACYGHPFHDTPRIDQLAKEGIRFTDFYATPVCSSTRGTIESGQNSARVGITDFLPGHWKPFAKLVVPPMPDHLDHHLTTPGEALGDADYVTGYFGKWHLGRGPKHSPSQHGYQITAGQLGESFQEWRDGRPDGPKRMNLITDQAIWFLKEQAKHDRPFFLHLSHHAVHIPIQAEPTSVDKYKHKPKPNDGVNHPVYAAMIKDLDRQIGRLLDTLDELQLANNTVVVVASDNGGLREIYTRNGQVVSTNAPLRAEKGTIYEGGIRVPLIIRWPDITPAESLCHQPTATWDLLPTFCAIAEIDTPDQPLDGVSLKPLLLDPKEDIGREALHYHYPHYHHSEPASAIRQGNFKLIEWLDDGSVELYELSNDIGETNNLASAMPEKANQLREDLAIWRQRIGAQMPTKNPKYDPKLADQWWNRRNKAPLNLKAIGDRFEQQATQPYFRTN
ncbi:MAG: sulfatase [Pirellulaceae bacterium]|nr:sulfatase [Pirellulaceae bacterium]